MIPPILFCPDCLRGFLQDADQFIQGVPSHDGCAVCRVSWEELVLRHRRDGDLDGAHRIELNRFQIARYGQMIQLRGYYEREERAPDWRAQVTRLREAIRPIADLDQSGWAGFSGEVSRIVSLPISYWREIAAAFRATGDT